MCAYIFFAAILNRFLVEYCTSAVMHTPPINPHVLWFSAHSHTALCNRAKLREAHLIQAHKSATAFFPLAFLMLFNFNVFLFPISYS